MAQNKTTVLILVFKEFLQINSTTDFCTLCKRVSRFSLEKFSSHSAEKFHRETLLCFRKFLLWKNVRDKRGAGVSPFSAKTFCLTVPKNFVEEPFCVSENFCYRKILGIREGRGISPFSAKIFLSHSAKKFRRGTPLVFH